MDAQHGRCYGDVARFGGERPRMTVTLEHPATEIERLHRCIDHLVALVALPASWVGAGPAAIATASRRPEPGWLHLR